MWITGTIGNVELGVVGVGDDCEFSFVVEVLVEPLSHACCRMRRRSVYWQCNISRLDAEFVGLAQSLVQSSISNSHRCRLRDIIEALIAVTNVCHRRCDE